MSRKPTAAGAPAPADVDKPEGPISAAILAAGVGSAALGALTTLAEASPTIEDWLEFSDAVGSLSGESIVVVAVWLAAWAILHVGLRSSRYETGRALAVALVLVGLGVLGTFPSFFQLFAAE